ncbi:uncharacterized protein [Miscanthus floridulus]|uniref:uncharacterized protein n=1 Tax=Miscanthus floridulus TaxID=154761 RepID=UPI003458C1A4
MLDQRLSTIPQHQWISKLFGFDFRVEYRLGRLNTVADALSRHHGDDLALLALSVPSFKLFNELRQELASSDDLRAHRDAVATGDHGDSWHVHGGLILHDGRVFVLGTSALLPDILYLAHTTGHERVQKALQ